MTDATNDLVFLGTSDFAVPALKVLIDSPHKPALVITQPDQPMGRKKVLTPPPVKLLALEHGIPVAQPESKKELLRLFLEKKFRVGVVVAYGRIIPQAVLETVQYGFLNIHPSLLPLYRGPSPIQSALLRGEQKTGVTIMKLDSEMDHGPILIQKEVAITPEDTNITLHQSLGELGAQLLLTTLPDYLNGSLAAREQDHTLATFCKILTREDGLIDWLKTALEIERQIRALMPWPGTHTNWGSERLKLLAVAVLGQNGAMGQPGQVGVSGGQLTVQTGDGVVAITRLSLAGKTAMSGQDFLRGYPGIVGATLS